MVVSMGVHLISPTFIYFEIFFNKKKFSTSQTKVLRDTRTQRVRRLILIQGEVGLLGRLHGGGGNWCEMVVFMHLHTQGDAASWGSAT